MDSTDSQIIRNLTQNLVLKFSFVVGLIIMKLSPSLSKKIDEKYLQARLAELERVSKNFTLPEFAEEYLKVHPDKREAIEGSHKEWLTNAKEWLLNHEDFKLSYKFIDGHPAFWNYSTSADKNLGKEHEYSDYPPVEFLKEADLNYDKCANFGVFCKTIFPSTKGNIFDLECGQAIHPYLVSSYHNYVLDAQGSSFEEAYVRVAFNLYESFGLQMSDDPVSGYRFSE